MKTYKIIHMKSIVPSFFWNDGLFAIIRTTDDSIHMCKIKENGQPLLFENGTFMITVVDKNNKGIKETPLFIKF